MIARCVQPQIAAGGSHGDADPPMAPSSCAARAFPRLARCPFRSKLTLLMLLSAGTALLIACLALIATAYFNDRNASDRRYIQIADVIANNLTAATLFNDDEAIQESLGSISRVSDIIAVGVLNARGEMIAHFRNFGQADRPARAAPLWTRQSADTAIQISGDTVTAPILLHGRRIGTVVMVVSRASFKTNFLASYPVAIAVFLVGLLLSYGVALLLRWMVFGPIERLTQAMQRIGASGDFSTRLGQELDPDFNRIVQSFNYVLGEIESRNDTISDALIAVRAARDAEQISEAKSQFMANMSHELRTPLNAIIGYSEVLKEELNQAEFEQYYDDVSWIYSSAQQLMALINGVLDFSKISAGRMTIEVQEFDPVALLREVEGMLEPMAHTGNNTLRIAIDGGVRPLCNDPTKFKQCVLNLGSNACKFTHDGTICINAYERADKLVVEVVDTGDGIDPARLESLFEPFIQGDASTTRRYGGTGLGLPITRELARLMGGDVSASSEPFSGSIFALEVARDATALSRDLPVAEPDNKVSITGPIAVPESEAPANATMVIIADEIADVELLSGLAVRSGWRVEALGNVGDGIRLIRSLQPQLAIIDLDLTGKSGWHALESLQSSPATREIPVVAISVHNGRHEVLALGASELLTKPVDRSEFAEILTLYAEAHLGTVLIVEDDQATARLFSRAMEQIGFSAMIAASAEEALSIVDRERVTLVVSDLGLPGMSGYDLIDNLALRSSGPRPPVIVVTGRPLNRTEVSRLTGKVLELHYKTGLSPRALAQIVATHARPGLPTRTEKED